MKLRVKLIVAPALAGVMLLAALGSALWVLESNQARSQASHGAVMAQNERAAEQRIRLGMLHTQLYRTIAIVGSLNDAAVKAVREKQGRTIDGLVAEIARQADAAAADEKLKQTLDKLASGLQKYRKSADNAIDLSTVDPNTGVAALQTADADFAVMTQALDAVVDHARGRAATEGQATEAATHRGAVLIGAFGLLAVLLSVGFAWFTQRRIVADVAAACDAASKVAAGRLDVQPHSEARDEIGDLLRALGAMVVQLRQSMGSVQQVAESIATASNEIASGNTDLSARTEQAASNLQQTASSMEQLTGTVRQSAESACTANQLAGSAATVAQRGGQVVSQVVATMEEINASSRKIADIISVIDGIAFQTNILALNAAVEAARAGEQGRGFAVVAGEVRSLAQRSAEAAKEIKALIGTSVEKVETGSRLVGDAGATMKEIVASVKRVSDIIGEITAASAEQSSGIGQVNTAVTQLDQMTQQNAALVEQSAAAAESLKQQARVLGDVVSAFRITA